MVLERLVYEQLAPRCELLRDVKYVDKDASKGALITLDNLE
jgi:hypothetical protein